MRRCNVRPILCVLALICSWPLLLPANATGASGEIKPQMARIATAGAAVHSGPGDSYYLTDTLPEGEAVEIYRRREDDWCAIRPPSDSFSWVFASNLQLDDEGLAKVTKDGTASRIGSRLSSNRDVVQVRLHKGEVVKVVGKDTESGETWYKIAPPAGEFRWIAANNLTFEDATSGNKAASSGVTRASHDEPTTSTQDGKSSEFMAPPLVSSPDPAPPSTTTFAASKPTTPAAQPVANTPAVAASTAATSPPPTATAVPKQDVAPIVSPAAATPEVAGQLRDLELRLSRMVAEPPSTWNTEALEQSAQQLLAKADTAADRDAVKVTLAKIDRFAAIQQRSTAANTGAMAGTAKGNISPSAITPLPGVTQAPSAANTGVGGQFDAVGVLRPVVSKRPGAPQFALVDERGQVVTFVTPTPDINLQPYLGQRIGVIGSRGYIPEFHRAHVTAARVAPLGSTVLR
jgi:uncharacterized protein YgiM (DUF1202 family)